MAELWVAVERLYHGARERPAAGRAAFPAEVWPRGEGIRTSNGESSVALSSSKGERCH